MSDLNRIATKTHKLTMARELIEQFTDLSLKHHKGGLSPGFFKCLYCAASGDTPPQVRHGEGCLVLKAKAWLDAK